MKKPGKRTTLIAAAAGASLISVLVFRGAGAENALAASGTVEGTEALVGFQIPGTVAEVLVREGDEVAAGQVLAVLDTASLHARRLQVEAQVSGASARLRELQAGSRPQEIEKARSVFDGARARLEEARRHHARTRMLYEGGVVSREAYENSATELRLQEQLARQAGEEADLVSEGPRQEQIAAQEAQLEHAQALLAETATAIANAVVRAPFPGVVTVRHREPGEVVPPGAPAVSLLDRTDRWVRVYFAEGSLAAVRIGAPVTITSDTYEDKHYAGEISFIASEAEFTPRSVQTEEERVKLVYAAKVRITGDHEYDLKPGMPADVLVKLPEESARHE